MALKVCFQIPLGDALPTWGRVPQVALETGPSKSRVEKHLSCRNLHRYFNIWNFEILRFELTTFELSQQI